MKGLFKKLVVSATSLAMVTSMSTAFAQTEMVFAGYDTSDPKNPTRVENEMIDGKYTGRQVREEVDPEDIEWVFEGYEGAYPHAGYSRLYIEGQPQEVVVYNNLYPQWETRRVDKTWEAAYPYSIYEQQQTKINNETWAFDYGNALFGISDDDLMTKTSRKATVTNIEMKEYGFGPFNTRGDKVSPLTDNERKMYDFFKATEAWKNWNDLTNNLLSETSLSERDQTTNLYKVDDEMIAAAIPVVYSKFITAKFNPEPNDNEGLETKDIAAIYLENDGVYSSSWNKETAWDRDSLVLLKNEYTEEELEEQLAIREAYRLDMTKEELQQSLSILDILQNDPDLQAKVELDYGRIADNSRPADEQLPTREGYFRYPVVNNTNHVDQRIAYTPAVVDIAWSEPVYEDVEPYRYFQYLIVNGVTLDGDINDNGTLDSEEKEFTVDLGGNTKMTFNTNVHRYTGGIANPVVEWKFERFDTKNVEVLDPAMPVNDIFNAKYPVIENKYLDGRKIGPTRNGENGITDSAADRPKYQRRRTGSYGMVYAEVVNGSIVYNIVDTEGDKEELKVDNTPINGTVHGTVIDGEYDPDTKSGSEAASDKTGGLVDPTYRY